MLHEGKKNFARFWFQLKKDCVLYRFKAHEVRGSEERGVMRKGKGVGRW